MAVLGGLGSRITKPMGVVAAILVVANGFVAGLAAIALQSSYQQYQERAAINSRNTNRLVAQTIAGEIERIDLGLQAVADEVVRQHAAGRIDSRAMTAFLRRQQSRLAIADGLRITDAGGSVAYGADAELPARVSIADRDYFQHLRDQPTRGLVISRPVLGKISGKWVLIFARRLSGPRGEFLGIVIAPVTIEWFEKMFRRLDVGPNGAVVLRGDASREFDLLGRFPPAGFVGQTKVSDQFRAHITANPRAGTYQAFAGADNIKRTFSYEAVGDYPLITLVGLATSDTLVSWWREVKLLGALGASFALFSLVGGMSLVRAWNTRAEAFERIRSLNEELERDIAARRKAEDELAALNAALELRVRDRTAALEAANKDLESFSYSASHDLRAPLRAIAGYAQILLEEERPRLSEEGGAMLERVVHNTHHMGRLIDDILDYSRAGLRPLEPLPLDMTAMAREAAAQYAGDYPQVAVQIHDMPAGSGDRTMVGQILQNLIGNAFKYSSRKPHPEVVVGADRDGGRIVYYVKDNGTGFDMRYAQGLFGMFHRMHKASDFEGTGVGLAIVKRLVERHRGEVWAHAEPDKGATFCFTLGAP